MVRFSYKRSSEDQNVTESVISLYEMIEELHSDQDYADVEVEHFSGVYRSQNTIEIECIEQLYELDENEGKLVEAEAEFIFDDDENSQLSFTYNSSGVMQHTKIESDSSRLAELAEDAILMEHTLSSRGISYLKDMML